MTGRKISITQPEPFGTFVERTDGTTEFRRSGELHTPTALGFTSTKLFRAPPDAGPLLEKLESMRPEKTDAMQSSLLMMAAALLDPYVVNGEPISRREARDLVRAIRQARLRNKEA